MNEFIQKKTHQSHNISLAVFVIHKEKSRNPFGISNLYLLWGTNLKQIKHIHHFRAHSVTKQ